MGEVLEGLLGVSATECPQGPPTSMRLPLRQPIAAAQEEVLERHGTCTVRASLRSKVPGNRRGGHVKQQGMVPSAQPGYFRLSSASQGRVSHWGEASVTGGHKREGGLGRHLSRRGADWHPGDVAAKHNGERLVVGNASEPALAQPASDECTDGGEVQRDVEPAGLAGVCRRHQIGPFVARDSTVTRNILEVYVPSITGQGRKVIPDDHVLLTSAVGRPGLDAV